MAPLLFAKITARVRSSKLLSQRNFNDASEKSPYATHFRGAMLALVLAALCAVFVVGLGRADYRAAQSLLEQGMSATGTVERVRR